MKLSDFILLTPDKKKLSLLYDGVLIGKRRKEPLLVFLFKIDDFYVEMCCNTNNKTVTEYRSFTDTVQLNPYLEEIKLDGLF